MAFDFTVAQDQEAFRQKAVNSGISLKEANDYIQQRRKQQEISSYGLTSEGKPNIPSVDSGKLTESQQKFKTALTASQDALSYLEGGLNTGPIASNLGKIGEVFGRTGPGTEYRAALALANTALKSAFLGGAQTTMELKGITDLIPKVTDQESVARAKLQKMIQVIGTQFPQAKQTTGLGLTPPVLQKKNQETGLGDISTAIDQPKEINVKGDMAQPGDLAFNPATGKLKISGQTDEYFKKFDTGNGGVSNDLVDFLISTHALPIAGSVIGALSGAGVGSVATGAAGAVAGKALEQALVELRDPNKYNLSDHARLVVVEGVTDAVLGGLTLGAFKLAGAGLKAGKGGVQLLLGKSAQGAEEGVASALENQAGKMVRKGLKVTPTAASKFTKATGQDFAEQVIKRGIPASAEAAQEIGQAGLDVAKAAKANILATTGDQAVNDVVRLLEEAKSPFIKTGVTLPAAESGVREIDKYIAYAKSFGDTIPATDVEVIKKGLQESFGSGLDVAGASKQLVTGASTKVKNFIETFHPDIAGTNKEIIFNRLLRDSGEKAFNMDKGKAFLSLTDLIIGSVNPSTAAIRKLIVDGMGISDPLTQAKILASAANLASQYGKKNVVRELINTATHMGIPVGLDKTLKNAGRIGVEATQAIVANPPEQGLPATPPDLTQMPQ